MPIFPFLSDSSSFAVFSRTFIALFLEAAPFLLLGSLLSSLVTLFVSREFIARILPKNRFLAIGLASVLGICFPVCECAIVPLIRSFLKKGIPLPVAITFMLSAPIVNPLVILSTHYAFSDMPLMLVLRIAGGIAGSMSVGLLVGWAYGKSASEEQLLPERGDPGFCHEGHKICEHCEGDEHHAARRGASGFLGLVEHTGNEFARTSRFLIAGALVSSAFKVFIPMNIISALSSGPISSIVAMMLLAFILSLCSEADAFIGKTFLFWFSPGSVFAFLLTGPMIDIKNTFMLLGLFNKRFTGRLIFYILTVCFSLSLIGYLIFMKAGL